MDPLMLIGLFFGGGVVFMVLFVAIMSVLNKGKAGQTSTKGSPGPSAGDAVSHRHNADNF